MTISINSPTSKEQTIPQTKEDIDLLNERAWHLESIDPREGLTLSKEAYHLSTTGKFHMEIYQRGVADSLFNQFHFNLNRGDYYLALSQSLEALSVYNDQKNTERQARTLCNMGAVYLAMNEYSKAMDTLLKGLTIARNLINPIPMGEILLNIGIAYLFAGDLNQALSRFKKSLQIFQSSDDLKMLAYAYCNLAAVYKLMGEDDIYLQYADRSQRFAEQIGSDYIKIDLLRQRGQHQFNQGNIERSLEHFQESLILSQKHGYQADEVAAAIWISEVDCQLGNTAAAADRLTEALVWARKYRYEEGCLRAYHKLSQIFASAEDYPQAYENLKAFYELEQRISKEKNELRFKTIETVYRTQAIQKEARIIQTKNEQLEKEIAERKWVEEALRQSEDKYRRLANLDALTVLNNRRFFYELAIIEMRRVRRYRHPMCILMIDIDRFKKINDRLGHLAGDQVLTWVARCLEEFLREVDIIGRFGGEEFIVLLPETDEEQGKGVAQRLCRQFADADFEIRNEHIHITVSIGLSSFEPESTLDSLIDHADQAMYAAKQAGRNRAFVWKNLK